MIFVFWAIKNWGLEIWHESHLACTHSFWDPGVLAPGNALPESVALAKVGQEALLQEAVLLYCTHLSSSFQHLRLTSWKSQRCPCSHLRILAPHIPSLLSLFLNLANIYWIPINALGIGIMNMSKLYPCPWDAQSLDPLLYSFTHL